MRRVAGFNLAELTGGLIVLALGGFVVFEASGYPFGQLTRMGPGFFPVVLGLILMALGVAVMLEGRRSDTTTSAPPLRATLFIFASVLAFAALVERLGLVPATFALVLLAALAERRFRPLTALAIAAALSVFGVLVFIQGLLIPLRAFWWS